MKVKIIRATIAQKRQVFPGEELDVSKAEAATLIGAGKAVGLKESGVETTAAPVAESQEPVGILTPQDNRPPKKRKE